MPRKHTLPGSTKCKNKKLKNWIEKLMESEAPATPFDRLEDFADYGKIMFTEGLFQLIVNEKKFAVDRDSKTFLRYKVVWKKKRAAFVYVEFYSRTKGNSIISFGIDKKITIPKEFSTSAAKCDNFLKTHHLVLGMCETCSSKQMVWVPDWCTHPIKFKECTECGNGHMST